VTPVIRRIRPDEGPRQRAFRLRALADAPMAFGSTLAREEAFTDDVWRQRAERGASGADNVTFVAEQDGRWLGIATGLASDPVCPTILGLRSSGCSSFQKHEGAVSAQRS
jgi:hypothetical protein